MTEQRKKQCFWEIPYDLSVVRLESGGKSYKTHIDETDQTLYVIEDDGERTYIVFS